MEMTELTPDEIEIIKRHREHKGKAEKLASFQKAVILVLNEWQKWADENGAGLTFSTFCNEFDVDRFLINDFHKNRKQIYDLIVSLKKFTYEESRKLFS